MHDWRVSTWGDEVTLEYGKAIRGYQTAQGPVPVYGTNGPIGWTDEPLYPAAGVILGRKGAYRGVHFSSTPFHVIDTAYYVVPKSDLDMRWLYYAIKYHGLGEIDDGSPIPSTTRAAVYVRDLYVPSKAEQTEMAVILSALDDKIELNRRMNETLEAQARALFRDWFVDFGPVKAKMAGTAPYLAPDVWSLFPDRLDDDGLPEGWRTYRVDEIADHHTKSLAPMGAASEVFEHFSLPAYDSGQQPVLEMGGGIKSNKTIVPDGAILLSKLNPEIPRVWWPQMKGAHRQIASTEFLAFTAKPSFSQALLYSLFSDDTFRQRLEGMVTGTSKSHQRVSPPALRSLEAFVGDRKAFAAFGEIGTSLMHKVLANRAENLTLAQTRDLLLPKLMSGEIRVREAEREVEVAL